ncbi:MAG: HAD family hydrolase [Pseudomonadota bacterium]
MKTRRFVLLDRDGTIIADRNYLSDPDQVKLLPGAAQGLRRLQALGLGMAIMSNQSGVGRGYFSEADLTEIHQRLIEILKIEGVVLDGAFYCPHAPEDDCRCRKPRPGLVDQARQVLSFDPADCFVVGDKDSDVELGRGIGAITILVRPGQGGGLEGYPESGPDYIVDDLLAASIVIEKILAGRG